MARKRILDKGKLRSIKVVGSYLTADLVDSCTSASFGMATSQVSEMSLSFYDPQLEFFNNKLVHPGFVVDYGGTRFRTKSISLGAGDLGPTTSVVCTSLYVYDLQAATGEKSWGEVDVADWFRARANEVGMRHNVQPGLGRRTIVRAKPENQNAESTWSVMTSTASEMGLWLFEYGDMLVVGKPSWLYGNLPGRTTWPLVWDDWNTYTDGLTGMPKYGYDPDSNTRESLSFELVSDDAEEIRPGDAVILTGRLLDGKGMSGAWIVTNVGFPMTLGGTVKVSAERPKDPVADSPQTDKTTTSGGTYGAAPQKAVGDRREEVGKFQQAVTGKPFDSSTALANQFITEVLGLPAITAAPGNWYASGGDAFTKVPVSQYPRSGDIFVGRDFVGVCMSDDWGVGHALIVGVSGGVAKEITVNIPGGHVGYLRPKVWQ